MRLIRYNLSIHVNKIYINSVSIISKGVEQVATNNDVDDNNKKMFQFLNRYINIDTYKKNGQAVGTPVWFVIDRYIAEQMSILTSKTAKE